MGLRLKTGVSPDKLRQYGFRPGREDFGKERWCGDGEGYEYQANWYHKFLTQDSGMEEWEDGRGGIAYTDDDFDIPMVQMSFRIGDGDDLYIDCAPSCTYHIGGGELDVVADTIYQLTLGGLVEPISGKH